MVRQSDGPVPDNMGTANQLTRIENTVAEKRVGVKIDQQSPPAAGFHCGRRRSTLPTPRCTSYVRKIIPKSATAQPGNAEWAFQWCLSKGNEGEKARCRSSANHHMRKSALHGIAFILISTPEELVSSGGRLLSVTAEGRASTRDWTLSQMHVSS